MFHMLHVDTLTNTGELFSVRMMIVGVKRDCLSLKIWLLTQEWFPVIYLFHSSSVKQATPDESFGPAQTQANHNCWEEITNF